MDQIEEFTDIFDNLGDLLIDFAFFINTTCLPCCCIDEHIVPKVVPRSTIKPVQEETELQIITDYWSHKVE